MLPTPVASPAARRALRTSRSATVRRPRAAISHSPAPPRQVGAQTSAAPWRRAIRPPRLPAPSRPSARASPVGRCAVAPRPRGQADALAAPAPHAQVLPARCSPPDCAQRRSTPARRRAVSRATRVLPRPLVLLHRLAHGHDPVRRAALLPRDVGRLAETGGRRDITGRDIRRLSAPPAPSQLIGIALCLTLSEEDGADKGEARDRCRGSRDLTDLRDRRRARRGSHARARCPRPSRTAR